MYGAVLFLAAGFFGYAVYGGAPQVFITSGSAMLAQTVIGASASVVANPYNSAVEQIATKEAELDAREQQIANREKPLKTEPTQAVDLSMYSFALSCALLLLVGMNFYFDWKRGRGRKITSVLGTVNLKQ